MELSGSVKDYRPHTSHVIIMPRLVHESYSYIGRSWLDIHTMSRFIDSDNIHRYATIIGSSLSLLGSNLIRGPLMCLLRFLSLAVRVLIVLQLLLVKVLHELLVPRYIQ